jgi:hypothetical protein
VSLVIAAFDLATWTGVCDGAVGGKPRLFSWFLDDAGDARPARLLMLAQLLRRYFEKEPCDGVVYEAPMPLGMMGEHGRSRVMMSEASVAFGRGAIGVLEMCCAEAGKPVEAVNVQDARQSVLGWRTNRDKSIETKKRVKRDVRALGIPFENDNESDAFVCWSYACNLQNPRLAIACTPLFRAIEKGTMP